MNIAHPLLLLLPFAVIAVYLRFSSNIGAILFPNILILQKIPKTFRIWLRAPVLNILSIAFLIFAAIAASRPQRSTVLEKEEKRRNLMLAIDVSGSMNTEDFAVGFSRARRIDAVKQVVAEFVKNRPLDRLGLVVFGGNAFLQVPLTLDHSILEDMVNRLNAGIARDGTAIGDGLGLSLKRIEALPGESKAIVLLTDGANNAGRIDPIKAAKVARDLGVKVHTIGIGSSEAVVTSIPGGFFGGQIRQEVEFDEKTLKEIAEITKGVYFNASDLDGLKKVYREIDKLEQTEEDEPERSIVEELYPIFGYLALISYIVYLIFSTTIFMKIP